MLHATMLRKHDCHTPPLYGSSNLKLSYYLWCVVCGAMKLSHRAGTRSPHMVHTPCIAAAREMPPTQQ